MEELPSAPPLPDSGLWRERGRHHGDRYHPGGLPGLRLRARRMPALSPASARRPLLPSGISPLTRLLRDFQGPDSTWGSRGRCIGGTDAMVTLEGVWRSWWVRSRTRRTVHEPAGGAPLHLGDRVYGSIELREVDAGPRHRPLRDRPSEHRSMNGFLLEEDGGGGGGGRRMGGRARELESRGGLGARRSSRSRSGGPVATRRGRGLRPASSPSAGISPGSHPPPPSTHAVVGGRCHGRSRGQHGSAPSSEETTPEPWDRGWGPGAVFRWKKKKKRTPTSGGPRGALGAHHHRSGWLDGGPRRACSRAASSGGGSLVGMNAWILQEAVVGEECLLGSRPRVIPGEGP